MSRVEILVFIIPTCYMWTSFNFFPSSHGRIYINYSKSFDIFPEILNVNRLFNKFNRFVCTNIEFSYQCRLPFGIMHHYNIFIFFIESRDFNLNNICPPSQNDCLTPGSFMFQNIKLWGVGQSFRDGGSKQLVCTLKNMI